MHTTNCSWFICETQSWRFSDANKGEKKGKFCMAKDQLIRFLRVISLLSVRPMEIIAMVVECEWFIYNLYLSRLCISNKPCSNWYTQLWHKPTTAHFFFKPGSWYILKISLAITYSTLIISQTKHADHFIISITAIGWFIQQLESYRTIGWLWKD